MKERPILFSAPMVRALLEGRKTVTRRIVKPAVVPIMEESLRINGHVALDVLDYDLSALCPFGQAGDRLWVRETWMENHSGPEVNGHGQPLYRASWGNTPEGQHWKPSIFMPRWACRLSLETTGVKVERLHDITEEQAKAEGVLGDYWEDTDDLNLTVSGWGWLDYHDKSGMEYSFNTARESFRTLWESINGAGSWAANPWVWAVSFKTAKPA